MANPDEKTPNVDYISDSEGAVGGEPVHGTSSATWREIPVDEAEFQSSSESGSSKDSDEVQYIYYICNFCKVSSA